MKVHRDMLNYHTSLNYKINCMGKKKESAVLCAVDNSSGLNIIPNKKGKGLN